MSKASKIWAIVPFSRPDWLENVKANFLDQTFQNKKICIVENGDAVGYCKSVGFEPDLLLSSEKHQAIAKATALDELKRRGEEFWTTWDDDDYYSPYYMQELADNSDKGDVIGKMCSFVKSYDDKLRLLGCPVENDYTTLIHGPTISAWTVNSESFHNVGKWSEDTAFVDSMLNKGAKVYATSRWNFIHQRHLSHHHTWTVSDSQMAQGWLHTHKNAYMFEYDCDMVTAKNFVDSRKSFSLPYRDIKKRKFVLEDCPAYTSAREEVGSMDDWVKSMAKKMGLDKKFDLT